VPLVSAVTPTRDESACLGAENAQVAAEDIKQLGQLVNMGEIEISPHPGSRRAMHKIVGPAWCRTELEKVGPTPPI
jgi:hypothetical protein